MIFKKISEKLNKLWMRIFCGNSVHFFIGYNNGEPYDSRICRICGMEQVNDYADKWLAKDSVEGKLHIKTAKYFMANRVLIRKNDKQ